MARVISQQATAQEIGGFATDSLTSIAQVLRRPDFKNIVNTSALTRNGVWGAFATNPRLDFSRHPSKPVLDLEFTDGQVALSAEFSGYLRNQLSRVNQEGKSFGRDIMSRVSSGCPVRHTHAQFTDSSGDRKNLRILSSYFGKPTEELLVPREQSVISRFLDVQANILDQADAIYQNIDKR